MQLMPNHKLIGTVVLAFILAWAGFSLTRHLEKTVPDSVFTTITGAKTDLKTLRGKPVLITFWATDCPSCISEIPHLSSLYQKFHHRGLELFAIAMYYDPPSHVVNMVQLKQLPYPVVLDLTAKHAQAFGNVQLTPTTFLVAPDGAIAQQITGQIDLADMQARIASYLTDVTQ